MPQDDLINRLARQIDAAKKAEHCVVDADCVAVLRRRGACELHSACAEFVSSVNSKLTQAVLDLSPPAYAEENFHESGANLIRIGAEGRELQITFEGTRQLYSTQKFIVPYVLEGEVRTYNQRMLEHFEIRSLALFFCVDQDNATWRFSDWRTKRTGQVGTELFVDLMGRLF